MFVSVLSLFSFPRIMAQTETLYVWFGGEFQGGVWHDTVYAPIGEWIDIPVYFSCNSNNVVVADMCLPLGINKDYLD